MKNLDNLGIEEFNDVRNIPYYTKTDYYGKTPLEVDKILNILKFNDMVDYNGQFTDEEAANLARHFYD